MKHKNLISLFIILFAGFLFFNSNTLLGQAPDTLVGWDFIDKNNIADFGIPDNLSRTIENSDDELDYPTAGGSVNTNSWSNGADIKYWLIDFTTTGYEQLTISSKQNGTATAPRDFKIQYRLDGTDWTDVENSAITVANDNFVSGVVQNLALPELCENQGKMYLRWIMTSNTSINGGTVSTGTSRITDIYIKGTALTGGTQYALTLSVLGNGATTPVAGVYAYNENTPITLTATPTIGYDFLGWQGEAGLLDATEQIIMNADKTITALFSVDTETIAGWNFNDSNNIADFGTAANSNQTVTTNTGGTVNYVSSALSSNGWTSGDNIKYWIIDINTTGYQQLTLSSKQQSSLTGPRDFKIQYRLDGTEWTDLTDVTTANNATTGVVEDIPLPAICNNQGRLYIRWIMSSNTTVNGNTVANSGTSRIDDIYVEGMPVGGLAQHTLTLSKTGEGTITPEVGTYTYNANTAITITAAADGGYTFAGWSGDLVSQNQTEEITVDKDLDIHAAFEEDIHAITVNSVIGGTATVVTTPQNQAVSGINVIINITDIEQGKRFRTIKAEGNNQQTVVLTEVTEGSEYTFTMPSHSVFITVEIESDVIPLYTIGTEIEGGTATVTTEPADEASAGQDITVTIANIEEHKRFKTITVTDAEEQAVEITEIAPGSSYTFTMPAAAVVVTVELENIPQYTLTVNTSGNGSVTVNGEPYTGTLQFYENTEINIATTPEDGWEFTAWSGDLVSGNSTETLIMNTNKTITATFTQQSQTITGWNFIDKNTIADEGITDNLNREITAATGATLTYSPNSSSTSYISSNTWTNGMDIKYWQIDFTTTNYNQLTVSSKQAGSGTGPRDFKIQYRLDGTEWTDVENSAITVANDNFMSGVVQNLALPALCENQGRVYLRWIMTSNTSINEGSIGNTGTNRITDIYVKGFPFVGGIQHTLTLAATGEGTLTPEAGEYTYNQNTPVTIAAEPAEGYTFAGWSGGLTSAGAIEQIVMTTNKSITANFTPMTYSITVNEVIGGTATVTAEPANEASAGSAVTVHISNIEDGKRFKSISVTDAENENITVAAISTGSEYTFTMPVRDVYITVELESAPGETHLINIAAVIGGTATVTTAPAVEAATGETVTVSIDDIEFGKIFKSINVADTDNLTVNTTEVALGSEYTFVMPAKEVTITVEIEEAHDCTLTIEIVGQGEVTVNGEVYTEPLTLEAFSEVTLSAAAAENWSFINWEGDIESPAPQQTITMNTDKTITAIFVTEETVIAGWNFTDRNDTADFGIGTNIERRIRTNIEGYIDYLGGATNPAISTTHWDEGANAKYWEINFTSTGYEYLTLSSKQQSSGTGPRDFKVEYRLDGTPWTHLADLTVANNATAGVINNLPLPATCTNQDNVHIRWLMSSNASVNGGTVASGGSNRIDEIYVKGFTHANGVQYTLTVAESTNGTTTPPAGEYIYNAGTQITLTAEASEGYIFEQWSGDMQSTENPATLIMEDNYSITAHFKVCISAEINPTEGTYNTEEPENPQTIITWNDAAVITTITTATDTLTAGSSYTLTAIDGTTSLLTFITGGISEESEIKYTINFDCGNSAVYTLSIIHGESYRLSFTVTDEDENEISDAVITINGTTHAAGNYDLGYLPVGDYDYSVARSGYITAQGTVELVDGDKHLTVVMEADLGITNNETPQKQNITIYPNPAVDHVKLERAESEKSTVEIYSAAGVLLHSEEWKTKTLQIDMSRYSHGIVLVKVQTELRADVYRVVKL